MNVEWFGRATVAAVAEAIGGIGRGGRKRREDEDSKSQYNRGTGGKQAGAGAYKHARSRARPAPATGVAFVMMARDFRNLASAPRLGLRRRPPWPVLDPLAAVGCAIAGFFVPFGSRISEVAKSQIRIADGAGSRWSDDGMDSISLAAPPWKHWKTTPVHSAHERDPFNGHDQRQTLVLEYARLPKLCTELPWRSLRLICGLAHPVGLASCLGAVCMFPDKAHGQNMIQSFLSLTISIPNHAVLCGFDANGLFNNLVCPRLHARILVWGDRLNGHPRLHAYHARYSLPDACFPFVVNGHMMILQRRLYQVL